MKIIPIIYTVRGAGPFPIDMLREDGSCPYSDHDLYRITLSMEETPKPLHYQRQVTLIKHNGYHHWTPNNPKWKALGWEVISVEEKRT